jgi:hypothetical protein
MNAVDGKSHTSCNTQRATCAVPRLPAGDC